MICFLFVLILISIDNIVISLECDIKNYYDELYCLSDLGQCRQCLSCWNNHTYFVPRNNTIDMTPIFCDNSNICSTCNQVCKNVAQYNEEYCPTCMFFIYNNIYYNINILIVYIYIFVCCIYIKIVSALTKRVLIESKKVSNINDYFVNINCDNNEIILIDYSIIFSNNNDCLLNTLNDIQLVCQFKENCLFNFTNSIILNNNNCNFNDNIFIEIGGFCQINTGLNNIIPYNNDIITYITSSTHNNSILAERDWIFICLSSFIFGIILGSLICYCYNSCKNKSNQSNKSNDNISDKDMPITGWRETQGSININSFEIRNNKKRSSNNNLNVNFLDHELSSNEINSKTMPLDAYDVDISHNAMNIPLDNNKSIPMTKSKRKRTNVSVILRPKNSIVLKNNNTMSKPMINNDSINVHSHHHNNNSMNNHNHNHNHSHINNHNHNNNINHKQNNNNYYSNEINNGNHDLVIESQYRYEQSFDWMNPQANYNSDTDDDDDVIDINNLTEIVKVNHNEIQFESEIGRSATGKVYKSRWKDNDVVTKRFHTNDINNEQALNYMNELNKKNEFFKHDNILKIYGYCLKPFLLIIENMDAGTLKNYTKNDTSIPMIEKVELLLQAALGLQHLHSKGIIHQNIAARNLLMSTIDDKKSNNNNSNNNNNTDTIGDDDTEIIVKAPPKQRYRVAVSDYGMTRILNEEVYAQTYASIGPLKWYYNIYYYILL